MTTTDSPDPKTPAVDLRALLKERGLKLAHLSKGGGFDKGNVSRWAKKRVPADRVADVERLTGIPRHLIRPDLYPAPTAAE